MKLSKVFTVFTFITVFMVYSVLTAQDFKEEEKSFNMDSNGEVTIDTYKGTIIVETWDKAEVHVYAKMEADRSSWGWGGASPEEQLENVKVVFESSANRVRIKSRYNRNRNHDSGTRALVHYKIKMPKTAKLDIDDYKSKIEISDLSANVRLETYKGRVNIKNLEGAIDLETYKGDVEIDLAKLKDDCFFETYKGNIEVALAENTGFDLDIDLGKKGDFRSDFDYKRSSNRRHSRDRVKDEINGGGPRIEFDTYRGDFRIVKR